MHNDGPGWNSAGMTAGIDVASAMTKKDIWGRGICQALVGGSGGDLSLQRPPPVAGGSRNFRRCWSSSLILTASERALRMRSAISNKQMRF